MCSEHVLDISDGLHEMGGFQSQVVVALVVAWAIVYLVLIKGVDSFGKVRISLQRSQVILNSFERLNEIIIYN